MGKVDLGAAFSKGWELFSKNMVPMIIGALLMYIIGGVTLGILMPILAGGLFIMIRKSWNGEEAAIGDIFAGFSNFGSLFLGGLLMLLMVIAGSILCGIGLFFTMPIVMFLFPLIVDGGMGPGEAFGAGWKVFKENMGGLILLNLVTGLLAGAGNAALYVGSLFTMPFAMCVIFAGYKQIFGDDPAAAAAAAAPAPAAPAAEPAAPAAEPAAPAAEPTAPAAEPEKPEEPPAQG